MHRAEGKIIYTSEDFERTVQWFGEQIEGHGIKDPILFSIYQGSLTLCHRLSKQYGWPHSIIKYQRVDGNDHRPILIHVDEGCYTGNKHKNLILVDDVYDSGKTITECDSFLKHLYPQANVKAFTIFKKDGQPTSHVDIRWQWDFDGTWIQFTPWEGGV